MEPNTEQQEVQTNPEVVEISKADLEKLQKQAEVSAQNYERAKKAEAEAKELKGKNISEPQKPSDILKAPEFRLHRQGYTEEEIDLIMHNGGPKILEEKGNPIVLGLAASKEQRNAEIAASQTKDSIGSSDIERKYSEAEMRAMKPDELASLIGYSNK